MSVDDQSDVWRDLREMKRKVARLESGSMLENASITRGRVRFIGGTLRVDSGGRVEIVGTLSVDGPWDLDGDGDITGDVALDGTMTVRNGQIIVQGANPITLAADSSGGAAVMFDGGGSLASAGTSVVLSAGDGSVVGVGGDSVLLQGDTIDTAGSLPNLPTGASGAQYVAVHQGILYKTSGVGGGGGSGPGPIAGDFMYPFDPSTTDPVLGVFGMRLNPVTGVWAMHNGQDFSVAGGSSIPAAGDGTVSATGFGSGPGNYIILDHGSGITTHYFHMQAPSPLSVGDPVEMGDTIGAVGTTGSSTGNHLHWEVHVNGSPVDPALFMANQEAA